MIFLICEFHILKINDWNTDHHFGLARLEKRHWRDQHQRSVMRQASGYGKDQLQQFGIEQLGAVEADFEIVVE